MRNLSTTSTRSVLRNITKTKYLIQHNCYNFKQYTLWAIKNCATSIFRITMANIDRFHQFFYCCSHWWTAVEATFPTSPQIYVCTTLRNKLMNVLAKYECSNIHLYSSYSILKWCKFHFNYNSKYLQEMVSFHSIHSNVCMKTKL